MSSSHRRRENQFRAQGVEPRWPRTPRGKMVEAPGEAQVLQKGWERPGKHRPGGEEKSSPPCNARSGAGQSVYRVKFLVADFVKMEQRSLGDSRKRRFHHERSFQSRIFTGACPVAVSVPAGSVIGACFASGVSFYSGALFASTASVVRSSVVQPRSDGACRGGSAFFALLSDFFVLSFAGESLRRSGAVPHLPGTAP